MHYKIVPSVGEVNRWRFEMSTRLTMSIPEAGKALGVSRTTIYKLANSGELPTIKLGKRILVPIAQLDRLLNGKTA
jgi:excisionase family DNA binding protein